MSCLTIGYLEDEIRKFPKRTVISLACGCCNHGSHGSERILEIDDKTSGAYGYVELKFNASSKAEVELNPDKEEFYKRELERLEKENEKLKMINERILDEINSIKSIPGRVERMISHLGVK